MAKAEITTKKGRPAPKGHAARATGTEAVLVADVLQGTFASVGDTEKLKRRRVVRSRDSRSGLATAAHLARYILIGLYTDPREAGLFAR